MLSLSQHTVTRLGAEHLDALERLMERCPDYQIVERGVVASREMAEEVLTMAPPGHEAGKWLLGVMPPDSGGRIDGVLDVIRDYPAAGNWYVGLLLLDPELRGHGLGEQVMRALETWMLGEGGRSIELAVLEHNAPAGRFWHREGFSEVRRAPFTASSGKVSEAIVMRKTLTPAGGEYS